MSKPDAITDAGVNRKLLVALGLLVVAALLFMFVVLPMLGPDEPEPFELPSQAAPQSEPEAPAEDDVAEDTPVPETFEVFSARDPFQQLVTEEGQQAAQETPVDPGGATPEGATATPTVAAAEVGATTVHLAEVVDAQRVRVTVNDKTYDVAKGDAFAEHFRLLEVNDGCATLLFGDNRFALCEGEQIRK